MATSMTDWAIVESRGYPRGWIAVRERPLGEAEAIVATHGKLWLGNVDDATVYETCEQAKAAARAYAAQEAQ